MYLAQKVAGQVLVNAESSFLLGEAGESDGWRHLELWKSVSDAKYLLLSTTSGLALGAAKAEARARLRASLNIVKASIEGYQMEMRLRKGAQREEISA